MLGQAYHQFPKKRTLLEIVPGYKNIIANTIDFGSNQAVLLGGLQLNTNSSFRYYRLTVYSGHRKCGIHLTF